MPQRILSEQEFQQIRDRVLQSAPDGLDEAGFTRWIGAAMAQAIGEAESTPALEGSATSRFLSNAGEMVNPVAIAQGLYQSVRHPVDTLMNVAEAQGAQLNTGLDRLREGRYMEAVGHGAAGLVPLLGPAAAEAGEQMSEGDWAGGLGRGVGTVATTLIPAAARGTRQAMRALPNSVAASAEAGAASRVADVMAPKVGPNKTRFGNMAERVAPEVAADIAGEGRMWSRQALQEHVGTRLADAEAALDAAANARNARATVRTDAIVQDLMQRRAQLTAQTQTAVPYRAGADVVPAPNAARVAQIDQAIQEIRDLGPVANYEALRRIRQAYDGPARAVYSPTMTADYLRMRANSLGAADVTGVLRERLAQMDPATAAANAEYSLWRTANDVMEATAEVERTRPRVGRQIVARMAGTVAGSQAAGAPGAVAGYVLGPIVDGAASAGATTQLATARMMQRLATAIRGGNVQQVANLTSLLRRMGVTASAQVGRLTSQPAGPLTTEPAPR